MRVRFSTRAEIDLEHIRAFLIVRSPHGAERVRRAIAVTTDILAVFPKVGKRTKMQGVYVVPTTHYPFLVYYKITNEEVAVVHVRHSARSRPEKKDF
ncbi:MAG: type II toxin-antitoxin system RelE/ParE family toxin [Patescibacteria group bacterium]